MSRIKISSALISVFNKSGIDTILSELDRLGVDIYSTGGTYDYIEEKGIKAHKVEDLTGYPSILDGRVKTLHPKVFGGILARREEDHLSQLQNYEIPPLDLVIVDLYPFQETVKNTNDEKAIIEKIDIGGIALIRAAAKNYKDVVIVPSSNEYKTLETILKDKAGETTLEDRIHLAKRAFGVSSHYDAAIFSYFDKDQGDQFKCSIQEKMPLRYGENPHQQGVFYGNLEDKFETLGGKPLSYNNLVDVDAAISLMREFEHASPTFAVLKHTNPCGVATRETVLEAWEAALAGDNISAFGGILISNSKIDLATAQQIDKIFYEVLIAPAFEEDALALLQKKTKRILLRVKDFDIQKTQFKSLINGVILQDTDLISEKESDYTPATERTPSKEQMDDLIFANKCVKHLKSNTIVLVKGQQLIGMGCGQTSRVDACNQAIAKAHKFGFDTQGAAMASDAFFPFPDCVQIAHEAGISAVVQPGGSIKDQLSIDYCNEHKLPMVFTGNRHFKH